MTMPPEKPIGLNNTSSENRRASKPLIEKRRRARINESLAQLKTLVIDSKKDSQAQGTRPPKLEKADILEMTVAYIRNLHRYMSPASEPEVINNSYRTGYVKCIDSVCQFLEIDKSWSGVQKTRLLSHLSSASPNQSSDSPATPADDSASSCSSGSRSGSPTYTPAHFLPITGRTSLEYLPSSPFSDFAQEGSSSSSSPPAILRTSSITSRITPPDSTPTASRMAAVGAVAPTAAIVEAIYAADLASACRGTSRVHQAGEFQASSPTCIDSNMSNCNLNVPLNLAASNSRMPQEEKGCGHYFVEQNDSRSSVVVENKEYKRNSNEGTDFVTEGNANEGDIMQMDPVWRPW